MPKPAEFHTAMAHALASVAARVVSLDETGSTNDDARALAREGAPDGAVVVANHQTSGRGRLARGWSSPPGLGLAASWIVRPRPDETITLIPLIAGVAAATAIRRRTRVQARLKWPNDVIVEDRKLGGILTEAESGAIVVGIGVNVSHTSFPPELPDATSIAIEGGMRLDRADLLAHILASFDELRADPSAALAIYAELCATLGRRVRVERVGSEPLEGVARAIEPSGALVLDTGVVAAGDVVHLRDAR